MDNSGWWLVHLSVVLLTWSVDAGFAREWIAHGSLAIEEMFSAPSALQSNIFQHLPTPFCHPLAFWSTYSHVHQYDVVVIPTACRAQELEIVSAPSNKWNWTARWHSPPNAFAPIFTSLMKARASNSQMHLQRIVTYTNIQCLTFLYLCSC